jgi:hypothetical protein
MEPAMLFGKNDEMFCRICGLLQDEPPWGADGQYATFNICDCCGAEFGYEDTLLIAIRNHRSKWERDGYKWFCPKEKPENWDPHAQMTQIPKHYL